MNELRFIKLAREKMVWKCPNCGAFLEKQLSPEVASSFVGLAGTNTCGNCKRSYSASDVYGGRLDVSVKDVLLALGPERLRDASAMEPLLEALKDEDPETQKIAADFLLWMGGSEVVPANSASQVILVNCGRDKIAVMKTLRLVDNKLSLTNAKRLAETPNAVILKGVSNAIAQNAKRSLESVGAIVEIR
jgi:large subunit ribosomal protein L7/L12